MPLNLLTTAINPIGGIASSLSSIGSALGIGAPDKNPGRLATNQRAYDQAVSGSTLPFDGFPNALNFLLVHSPVAFGGSAGWATDLAQQDAWSKYQQARAMLSRGATAGPLATGFLPIGQSGSQNGLPVVSGVSASAAAGQTVNSQTKGYVVVGLAVLAMLFIVKNTK